MTIRVVVADDEPLIRGGVVMLLASQNDIEVVAEAGDGAEAVSMVRQLDPDVVLMDVLMPGMDGVAATRLLNAPGGRGSGRPPKVLILTTFVDDTVIHGALLAGACGFLLKHTAPSDLVRAIRRVADGQAWLDPAIAKSVISAFAATPRPGTVNVEIVDSLTVREAEVLELMALGLSNCEIGERLYIGEGTVKTHVSRVLMKTSSRDRAQAIAFAYQTGMVAAGAGRR